MVTKAAGNRWQVTIKSATVTAEWEQTIKVAAKRQGTTFADFIVHTSNVAALAVIKQEPVPTAAVPIRIEDVAAGLQEQLAKMAAAQDARAAELRQEIARHARRGRWRR